MSNIQISQFHESYRQVDWNHLLKNAKHSLTIAVYYWDKWVKEHEKALFSFLEKQNTQIQFFFSENLQEVQRLFPNNSEEQLAEKIRKTYQPLMKFSPEKVKIYFFPELLNYSMQCVDNKILILSFFEMFREKQVDSPAIVIDLEKSPHLLEFYQKELNGLLKESDLMVEV